MFSRSFLYRSTPTRFPSASRLVLVGKDSEICVTNVGFPLQSVIVACSLILVGVGIVKEMVIFCEDCGVRR